MKRSTILKTSWNFGNFRLIIHRYYTKDEFGVQTCSKCLQWMPEELFRKHEVENATISIQRSLITSSETKFFDILNPLTFKV